jgi:hypothetical protein
VVFKKRKAARRLTVQEKFLIKKQIENIWAKMKYKIIKSWLANLL